MSNDLTVSMVDRQNILNNEFAIGKIKENVDIEVVFWNDNFYLTEEMLAKYFQVDLQTITSYLTSHSEELSNNGYELLKGKRRLSFLSACKNVVKDVSAPRKPGSLGVFSFRAFLNMAMLLSENQKAQTLRQLMINVVLDLFNKRTGANVKYINQRDTIFPSALARGKKYRRIFTDVIKECVVETEYKYSVLTNKIYVSIFREKAKEYKEVLELKKKDKTRETFYSEVLNLVSAYECGFADQIQHRYEKTGRLLTMEEVNVIFSQFEKMPLWEPLVEQARTIMSSRDKALRAAIHPRLNDYTHPLPPGEFQKFLGTDNNEPVCMVIEKKARRKAKGR